MSEEKIKVFVSYCHADSEWLERLKIHLSPLKREYDIDVWEDTRIKPGSKWREEIREAIDCTNVAVLIISADFLASDFIRTDELPPLLKAAEEEGALILSIIASPSLFSYNPDLSQFQTVNDPSRPLLSLSSGEQEEVFMRVARAILERATAVARDQEIAARETEQRREDFLEHATWNKLLKIGDWIFDADEKQILGSGMHSYLLSRMEYGKVAATVHISFKFSNFRQHLQHQINKMNAGIVFGWNSDKANPRYYNVLLTGEEMLIERIGFQGGEAYRDFDHETSLVPFPITEGKIYDLTLSLNSATVDVLYNQQIIVSLNRPTGVVGRVGLRPWRSQVVCTKFVVSNT